MGKENNKVNGAMVKKNYLDLTDKIALVSGGSRGIGEAICHGLANEGATVVVSSRKIDACEKVAEDIRAKGGKAVAKTCHAGNMDDIERIFNEIESEFGGVDVLVNNGGTNPYYGPIADTELWAFDKTIEVNLRGPFFLSAQAVKQMQKRGGGSIVNVASIDAIQPGMLRGIYSMTKAAMVNMTKSFAKEYGKDNIRVNALCPGFIDTNMTQVMKKDKEFMDEFVAKLPLGRMGDPEDMVGAVLYFASDASKYTTGTTIVADGGIYA